MDNLHHTFLAMSLTMAAISASITGISVMKNLSKAG